MIISDILDYPNLSVRPRALFEETYVSGTQAAVCGIPGLRDSVIDKETGIVSLDSAPRELAARIVDIFRQPEIYGSIRENAYERSKTFSWNRTADAFYRLLRNRRESLTEASL